MFGFYDPKSLKHDDKGAVIDFINAEDASDITPVEIRSEGDVARVREAISNQVRFGITTMNAGMKQFRGSIAFNPLAPGEGLLTPEDDPQRITPIRLGFKIGMEELPTAGIGMGDAVMVDGALVIRKLAMKSFMPVSAPRLGEDTLRGNMN